MHQAHKHASCNHAHQQTQYAAGHNRLPTHQVRHVSNRKGTPKARGWHVEGGGEEAPSEPCMLCSGWQCFAWHVHAIPLSLLSHNSLLSCVDTYRLLALHGAAGLLCWCFACLLACLWSAMPCMVRLCSNGHASACGGASVSTSAQSCAAVRLQVVGTWVVQGSAGGVHEQGAQHGACKQGLVADAAKLRMPCMVCC